MLPPDDAIKYQRMPLNDWREMWEANKENNQDPVDPDPKYWVWESGVTASGILFTGGHWRRKTQDEIDEQEAWDEVNRIAPGIDVP